MSNSFTLSDNLRSRMQTRLAFLYGDDRAPALMDELILRLRAASAQMPPSPPSETLSERDAILITYGDIVQRAGQTPLHTLRDILTRYLSGVVSGVHILPFFPYSSDDGFSIIDYTAVNPDLGGWDDVAHIGADFRLMFDAVINHISVQSDWFQAFLRSEAPYTDYFITVSPDTDLSQVTRPRALPLLTAFETARGIQHVWTTFSTDQVDLNFATPAVLFAVLDVILTYAARGASLIRLDAIAYLWKTVGTSCIHLPQTHAVVKLMRDVFDTVAPWVRIITETNVPHEENLSYFGDGSDEAQLVYQFSLPPLALHALLSGSARHLTHWAASLALPSDQTTFFNFTASHDGVGVRPVQGILSDAEIEELVRRTKAHGGNVSYKTNSDGTQSPYELNINYFDALSDPTNGEPLDRQAARFLVSQAIMLAMQGVPGIYFHNLFGSRNYAEGVEETGHFRTINREKLDADALIAALDDSDSLRARVFFPFRDLIRTRCAEPAFHPNGAQRVLDLHDSLFVLLRTSPDGASRVIALHNVADAPVAAVLDLQDLELDGARTFRDIVSGETHRSEGETLCVALAPYAVCWLKEDAP